MRVKSNLLVPEFVLKNIYFMSLKNRTQTDFTLIWIVRGRGDTCVLFFIGFLSLPLTPGKKVKWYNKYINYYYITLRMGKRSLFGLYPKKVK